MTTRKIEQGIELSLKLVTNMINEISWRRGDVVTGGVLREIQATQYELIRESERDADGLEVPVEEFDYSKEGFFLCEFFMNNEGDCTNCPFNKGRKSLTAKDGKPPCNTAVEGMPDLLNYTVDGGYGMKHSTLLDRLTLIKDALKNIREKKVIDIEDIHEFIAEFGDGFFGNELNELEDEEWEDVISWNDYDARLETHKDRLRKYLAGTLSSLAELDVENLECVKGELDMRRGDGVDDYDYNVAYDALCLLIEELRDERNERLKGGRV